MNDHTYCEYYLEKEIAAHSSILAWKIPWTEEPGGLHSMGQQSQTPLSDFTFSLLKENVNLYEFLSKGVYVSALYCKFESNMQ